MAKPKILIVEDELLIADDLRETLLSFGYEVTKIVSSGEDTLREIIKNAPDLVLMDIKIKGDLDGIDTAEIIFNQFNIPVIFLSAFSSEDTINRAKIADSYGFLEKPYETRELFLATDFALYKHSSLKKVYASNLLFDAILQSISEIVVATDSNGLITFMNSAAEKFFGLKEYETKGVSLNKLLLFDDIKLFDDPNIKKLKTKDAKIKMVELKTSKLHAEKGSLLGELTIVKEINLPQ